MEMGTHNNNLCNSVSVVSEQKKCLRTGWSLPKLAKLHEPLGMKLNFSTAFNLQTDGKSECVIQILENMLRACVSNTCLLVRFVWKQVVGAKFIREMKDIVKVSQWKKFLRFNREGRVLNLLDRMKYRKEIEIQPSFSDEEQTIRILAHEVKEL
ncbi:DNA/RNA polymerase superfamily protein [Gossypium australe]|uniref:DNA/RNA polymerase superfamily protein n=1 Tax=Gossypium australe TaxID=47621 RepID=A0A5B6X5P7_9ROSI|nr:DNA/RNA polymerase superfamily protein [Gossypium australe]